MDQLPDGRSGVGHYSQRPRWRSDATGAGRGVTGHERWEFTRHVLDMVHCWPDMDATRFADLVHRAWAMPEDDQSRVWACIIAWGRDGCNDRAKGSLRELIRSRYLTRVRSSDISDATIERARRAFDSLEPEGIVVRHLWLFGDYWIEPSVRDVDNEDSSHEERQAIIRKLRGSAVTEILDSLGLDGVISLLSEGVTGAIVGTTSANVMAPDVRAGFLMRCLNVSDDMATPVDAFMVGFLQELTEDQRTPLLQSVMGRGDSADTARLLRCAPFREDTWRLVERAGPEVEASYWGAVKPQWARHSESELAELIDRLMQAGRPRSAFWAANRDWSVVETSRLTKLLNAVATQQPGPTDECPVDAFDVQEAMRSLNERAGVTPEDMAPIEFMYLDALDHREYGLPNLEKQIACSPELYFRALTLVFRRHDRAPDPPEWRIDDHERAAAVGVRARKLLDRVKRLPGADTDGRLDLRALLGWVAEVRRLCGEHGRAAIGDQMIGQLLARSDPVPEDEAWPRAEVCEVLEQTASREMGVGFCIGVYNARGVHVGADDGEPERGLSANFRRLANDLSFKYPFVSRLLEEIGATYDREAKRRDIEGLVRKRLA